MSNELENLRVPTLVLLDVAANQMAIQKVLCDAHIGTPEAFQVAYEQQYREQLEAFRERILAGDGAGLRRILQALATTPHQI